MATVKLKLPHHAYDIRVEPGALGRLGEWLAKVAPHERAALLFDEAIRETHAKTAQKSIESAGYNLLAYPVRMSESDKNLDTVRGLYDVLVEKRLERKSPIVVLGGGVVGDTSGFVASTYLRGVPFVQCPTTLLAMVDASVGGKVGVNLAQGKNLVGSFYQPNLVVIDTETLRTLPPRELRCGLAECVKHCILRDANLFEWIETHLDKIMALESDALVELVSANVQIKADVVMADEKEAGLRAHLNLGHTFGHAIEATQQYGAKTDGRASSSDRGNYVHGEAVALGMVAATELAVSSGRCNPSVLSRLVALLDRIGLPIKADDLAPTHRLIDTMRVDKKVADGKIRLVLPDRIGKVSIVSDVADSEIGAAWEAVRGWGG